MQDPIYSERPQQPMTAIDVLKIAVTPDPEVRNHRVTLAYWEMSRYLDHVIHHRLGVNRLDRTSNANWFTVATWAIRTVGHNIRSDELPRRLDQVLPAGVRAQASPWLLSMRSRAGRRVQRSLDYGQIIVFMSAMVAALEFLDEHEKRLRTDLSEILEKLPDDGRPIDLLNEEFAEPLGGLAPTRPRLFKLIDQPGRRLVPRSEVEDAVRPRNWLSKEDKALARHLIEQGYGRALLGRVGGPNAKKVNKVRKMFDNDEDFDWEIVLDVLSSEMAGTTKPAADLRAGFMAYQRAAASDDPAMIAHEVYRGNLIIAAVEQVLLDRPVTNVVDHVPREFEDWMETRASVLTERTFGVPRALGRLAVSRQMGRSLVLLKESWARFLTDQVLVLVLPTETLRIGRDIPLRAWNGEFVPSELLELPTEAPVGKVKKSEADQLSTEALYRLFDRSRGDGVRTGAWDWRRFDERLNFTANLLRSRQQDRELFWQPYNSEDRERLHDGNVPLRTATAFEPYITPLRDVELEDLR